MLTDLNPEDAEMVAPSVAFLLVFYLFKIPVNVASRSFFFPPDASPCRYKKTQETISQAGQKTSAAMSTMSDVVVRKLGEMR